PFVARLSLLCSCPHRDVPSFPTRRSSDLRLVDGPFRNLRGRWVFKALDENACKVALQLDFEFSGKLARMAFGPLFNHAANTMVEDRKSTRLNSSHVKISYAVFCLKKKKYN